MEIDTSISLGAATSSLTRTLPASATNAGPADTVEPPYSRINCSLVGAVDTDRQLTEESGKKGESLKFHDTGTLDTNQRDF